MKKTLKRIGLGLLAIFVLLTGLFVVPHIANIVMPWDRADAIESAMESDGLHELPESADNVSVDTEGSLFTRDFIIEFNCNKNDLDNWIRKSNLDKLTPTKDENGVEVYQVPGQNGAIGGHVYIDKNKVTIDMSWS